jgi:hypothetical protein
MNILRPIPAQIEHQKAMLADADRKYLAYVTAGKWAEAAQEARRYNRIWNALVLHGVVESFREIDREAVEARRDD